jgi:diaminopimelate epimerase
MRVFKAHAYGNDFLLAPRPSAGQALSELACTMCHRHQGIGADGLIFYTVAERTATMLLFNADGSPSELSGNGVRCLGALLARDQRLQRGDVIAVVTDAGEKRLELQESDGQRYTFRTWLGQPTDVRRMSLEAAGERVEATVLGMGNPQCVVLGSLPDAERFERLGPALATHAVFPAGTNVEFAEVISPTEVRILIWERGVGPTTSSGTGTAASAVAAAAHGGATRDIIVIAPGGSQLVEWRDDGVYLTGWAEVVLAGEWLAPVTA